MMSKIFIETNILIYSMDKNDPTKMAKSRELLKSATENYQIVLSTQVLQEFYVTATKKLGADPLITKDILHHFEQFEIIAISAAMVNEAIDCSVINKLSFWDALIVVAAESSYCETIWTEDLNDGQRIRGVLIKNPL